MALGSEQSENEEFPCPKCAGDRCCTTHGELYIPWYISDNSGNSMSGGATHYLLQCDGCKTAFYLSKSWNEDDVDHFYGLDGKPEREARYTISTYPKPNSTVRPIWLDKLFSIDEQLWSVMNEVYIANDNDAFILTAVGLRTAIDRATEVLQINPAITFGEKLAALLSDGYIGTTEHEILGVVTNAGSAAAHRGWSPTKGQLEQLVLATEMFLHKAFIFGTKALEISETIPPRPPRNRRAG